jgi:ribosomal protein L16 Arg81 hydroxylase|tara:strand:+ start:109 stop:1071 length:963 start_codon:yes stop_codon:yes gene_type:complete
MGLYRRLAKSKPTRTSKHTHKPLPPCAHLVLSLSLLTAIVALLAAPTLLPYLRNNATTTVDRNGHNGRQTTLLPNNTYNFDTTFCNIPRIRANTLTKAAFVQTYAGKHPVILLDSRHNQHFLEHVTKSNILTHFGQYNVILSASNSYTKHKKTVTVKEYISTMMKPQTLHSLGNETWYLFGDNYGEEWTPLLNRMEHNRYAGSENTLSFGIGGKGSGVPFHFHGGGFSEVFHGRKRWFLTAHEHAPKFNPDHSMLQWVQTEYWQLYEQGLLDPVYECTIGPGEMLYFPSQWHHGVLNLDPWTSFVSTFTLGEELLLPVAF